MGLQFEYDKDKFYEALIQSAEDYIYVCDLRTNITRLPNSLVYDFNLLGKYIHDFSNVWLEKIHPDERGLYLESLEDIIIGVTDDHNLDYRALNRENEWVWVRCRGHIIRDHNNKPELFAGIITNIGKKNKVDITTGLLNKFEFENQINYFLHTSEEFSVIVINIDNFKNINYLYDREFGDSVLRITGQYLQNSLPSEMEVYRLDSDEFGIITKIMDNEQIKQLYYSLKKHFTSQHEYRGKKYHSPLSAGCYIYNPDIPEDYQTILKKAHKALDYTKSNGKNKITFYESTISENKTRELELLELLHESVNNNYDNFELHCQPQVFANNGRLKGAEALLRWKCDKYGVIAPYEFIPLLEKSNLIIPVGKWVFTQAVRNCAKCIEYFPNFKMSINVSYIQLLDSTFVDFIKSTIEEENICFSNIIVELTESRFVSDKDLLKSTFASIRNLGMDIAMDDFGTGYSSLEILKEVPADIVKIDRAFVRNIMKSSFDKTFIKFIVELCHDVGIKVCLEGIEHKEEMEIVSPMNLDFIQGYLFGKPQHTDSFFQNYLLKQ